MIQNIRYGLQNGIPKYIEDVDSGLNCNCVCAGCGGVLIAKKGEKKLHHFAHYDTEQCFTGFQTSIHLMAKDIILENKSITLPDGSIFTVDKVELEKKVDSIIPDIMVYVKDRPLIVEIFVTHKVDEIKKNKIQQLGISAIEIDLSHCDYDLTKDTLKNEMYNACNINWIFNQKKYEQEEKRMKLPHRLLVYTGIKTVWCQSLKNYVDNTFCDSCPKHYDDVDYNSYCFYTIPVKNYFDDESVDLAIINAKASYKKYLKHNYKIK